MSWLFGGSKSSESSRNFNVIIYEEDYKQLCAWVLKKPNIETGGDLFGLWSDKRTAVIQLVLGPGQGCSRTSVSFYQDVNYLQRVGSYLTQNEGVCHIGEWHSHHQLGLAQPSGGDENTVWNNMPTYKLKRFVIFIANIQSSKQSYNVNIGCFLFEIDDHDHRLAVLPGEFTILQKKNLLSLKQEVSMERSKDAEMDDESKITIKDLKLEVKGGRDSQPSVTYLKPSPTPNNKRNRREKKNQLQNENHDGNKADDEESCGDSKKQKMDIGASSPTTASRSPGDENTAPSEPLISEDIQNLTINDEQPDKQPEGEMEEVDEQKEQPEKKKEEETTEDDNDEKNSSANNQNEFFDQKFEKEKSELEENKDEIAKVQAKGNACPPEGDQRKPDKKSGDKESPPQQPRPLPPAPLNKETPPPEQTGRQTFQVEGNAKAKVDQSKESAPKEGRPLPELKEGPTPTGQTGRRTLQDEDKTKTKADQSKQRATRAGKPPPKVRQEMTPAKTKTEQSKERTSQGRRPQPTQGKTPTKGAGKPMKKDAKSDMQSSGKKDGSSGTGLKKDKNQK